MVHSGDMNVTKHSKYYSHFVCLLQSLPCASTAFVPKSRRIILYSAEKKKQNDLGNASNCGQLFTTEIKESVLYKRGVAGETPEFQNGSYKS